MKYEIITAQNFSDIEKLSEAKKESVKNSFSVDLWQNYGSINFAVIGEDALQMFREKYGYKLQRYSEPLKTDGKTRAKILPFISPEYYFDARNGGRGGIVSVYDHSEIGYLIEFDGVLFRYYGKNTVSFSLFNDNTDYYNYLPYNWDKNNPAPNNVGVITDKKIEAWKKYLLSRKFAAEAEKNRRENSAAAFLAKIKNFDSTGCKKCDVGETSGRIVCNGLEYTYKISNGVISERISVHYSASNNFDTFIKMINGEF